MVGQKTVEESDLLPRTGRFTAFNLVTKKGHKKYLPTSETSYIYKQRNYTL